MNIKKLITLMLCFALALSVVACGGGEKTESSEVKSADATVTLKDKASVFVGETVKLEYTVDPADAKLSWSSSDKTIAMVDKTGEVSGEGTGTATITCNDESGKQLATCEVTVSTSVSLYGAVSKQRTTAPEKNDETDAMVILISKDIAAGTDMQSAVDYKYGEAKQNYFSAAYEGFYVAKTNDYGKFLFKGIPEGDYTILVISGDELTYVNYMNGKDGAEWLKSKELNKYFTDAQIAELGAKITNVKTNCEEISVASSDAKNIEDSTGETIENCVEYQHVFTKLSD